MNKVTRMPVGVVFISVIMFFVGLATDIFWVGKLGFSSFRQTILVDPSVYNAFVVPDLVLSFTFFISAYGLLRLRTFGFFASLIAIGMWLFDLLLLLAITKLSHINIIGPSLFFIIFALVYLWRKKELFS